MQADVTAGGAFIAGVVSFLSPCVLPLVPGYISMLSGMGVEQLKQGHAARSTLLASSLSFVAGFSVVFVAFGASASAVGKFLVQNKNLMAPVAGAVIVLFGLHLVGLLLKLTVQTGLAVGATLVGAAALLWLRPNLSGANVTPVHLVSVALIFLLGPPLSKLLHRDVHMRGVGEQPGIVGGFLMGFAFAFGWTPCIGPILASVLLVAATRETVGQGVFLLSVYSAGLAIPFLLTALGIGRFLKFYQKFRKHLHTMEVCSGVLLLFVGGLVFFNRLTWLSNKLGFLTYFAW